MKILLKLGALLKDASSKGDFSKPNEPHIQVSMVYD